MYTHQDWQKWEGTDGTFVWLYMIAPLASSIFQLWLFFISTPLSRSPSHPSMPPLPHPNDFAAAHQYWPLSLELMIAIPPVTERMRLTHQARPRVSQYSHYERQPSQQMDSEWAVVRKLLSYFFCLIYGKCLLEMTRRISGMLTVSHPHIEFVESDK